MNIARKLFFDSATSQISPFWRGQLFLFDRPRAPTYSSGEGPKLLLVFLFLEGIVRPLLAAGARWLTIAERKICGRLDGANESIPLMDTCGDIRHWFVFCAYF
jgi:hypothetical protein